MRFIVAKRGAIPSCFPLQPLFLPGAMYFTSLVMLPRGTDPQRSVRRPGINLNEEQTNLHTNSTREVQSYSPVLLPESANIEPYLQNVIPDRRESSSAGGNAGDSVGGGEELDHD